MYNLFYPLLLALWLPLLLLATWGFFSLGLDQVGGVIHTWVALFVVAPANAVSSVVVSSLVVPSAVTVR